MRSLGRRLVEFCRFLAVSRLQLHLTQYFCKRPTSSLPNLCRQITDSWQLPWPQGNSHTPHLRTRNDRSLPRRRSGFTGVTPERAERLHSSYSWKGARATTAKEHRYPYPWELGDLNPQPLGGCKPRSLSLGYHFGNRSPTLNDLRSIKYGGLCIAVIKLWLPFGIPCTCGSCRTPRSSLWPTCRSKPRALICASICVCVKG